MAELETTKQPAPEERVFATFKLYLDDDNHIAGETFYDGPKLETMKVKPYQAILCQHAAKHVHQDIQGTVEHISQMRGALGFLNNIFEQLGEVDDSEDDDSDNDNTNNEQSATATT